MLNKAEHNTHDHIFRQCLDHRIDIRCKVCRLCSYKRCDLPDLPVDRSEGVMDVVHNAGDQQIPEPVFNRLKYAFHLFHSLLSPEDICPPVFFILIQLSGRYRAL